MVLSFSRLLGALALTIATALPVQATNAAEPKTLRYAFEIAETGFDPVQLSDLYSRIVTCNLFDTALRYAYLAPAGTLEPNVVTAMPEISADFRTFTFHLKHGIYFIDDPVFKGKKRELVAEDFVYTFKRHYDPRWKSPNFGSFEPLHPIGLDALREAAIKTGKFDYDKQVDGIRALDRYTFRVQLEVPSPRFLDNYADSSILGTVAREVVEHYGDSIMEHPVGTGPFKLGEWVRSSKIVLDRNPDYRDDFYDAHPSPDDPVSVAIAAKLKGRKMPMVDRVEIAVIEESQPRWLAFLNGDMDYIERVPLDLSNIAIPNNKLAPNLAKRNIFLDRVPVIDVTIAVFNMENPVIGGYTPEKIALRRAISLGFDSNEMIAKVYKYQAIPAQSIIQPMTYGYDPHLRTEMGETDVDKANALLDAYGFTDKNGDGWRDMPDGSPLVLEYSTQPDQRSRIIDEIWKKSMNALHVKLVYKVAKWPDQLKSARAGKFMFWGLGQSSSSPDSAGSLRLMYGPSSGAENLGRFKLAAYDKLFQEQDALPNGPERLAKIREMQKIITAYAPMDIIAHRYAIDMTYPWVIGFRRWPFARDWWRYVDIDEDLRKKTLN